MLIKKESKMKERLKDFKIPVVNDFNDVIGGDSPGDKVMLCQGHVDNTNIIFPHLVEEISKFDDAKLVISVAGGSGVGKSGIAALLSHYLTENGVKSYVMSGDNYPNRRAILNDLERTSVFRKEGLKGLVASGEYTQERFETLVKLQKEKCDAGYEYIETHPWLEHYIVNGEKGLTAYLGSSIEQDFEEVNNILSAFKSGEETICLKRMGPDLYDVYYEAVDFSNTDVIVLEWTHAMSEVLEGIDIPVVLCSTPEETIERRKLRNRGNEEIDTPFIMMVLRIEQKSINAQVHKAKVLLSSESEIITVSQFQEQLSKGE